MKKLPVKKLMLGLMVTSVLSVPLVMADQMDSDASQAKSYVKDSVITTKVKTKLAAKHLSTLTNVKVDTDAHGAVWLSGKAPTHDASDLAAMIAKNTDGVTSVHNDIVVE
jgi:hyperosmotically inducible protein